MQQDLVGTDPAAPTRAQSPVYCCTELTREFRQAEIISDLRQHTFNSQTEEATEIAQQFVIILSQDCDLLWDLEARSQGKDHLLNGILFYELWSADLRKLKLPTGSDIWKRIKQNKDERYQFFEAAAADCDAAGVGLPELVLDFRKYFTMPHDELLRQLEAGPAKRRSRLLSPYKDHLQARAGFYFQRVMLPLNHQSVESR